MASSWLIIVVHLRRRWSVIWAKGSLGPGVLAGIGRRLGGLRQILVADNEGACILDHDFVHVALIGGFRLVVPVVFLEWQFVLAIEPNRIGKAAEPGGGFRQLGVT